VAQVQLNLHEYTLSHHRRTWREYCRKLVLLRSEIPSGMCAKLRTVAASNNRDHPTRSLYYCLFAPQTCIFVLRAHPVRSESHNQRNTTGEVATVPCRRTATLQKARRITESQSGITRCVELCQMRQWHRCYC